MEIDNEAIDFSDVGDFNMDVFNTTLDDAGQPELTEPAASTDNTDNTDNTNGDPVVDETAEHLAAAQAVIDEEAKEAAKEVEESVADDKKDSDQGEEGSSSPEIYSSFASALIEQGILSPLEADVKINDANDLIGVLNTELKNREFADLNESQKTYLEGLRNGIPEATVQEQLSLVNELNSVTPDMLNLEDNTDLRKEVIKQNFIKKGFAPEKASSFAQRSVDSGNDVEDSLEAIEDLKAITRQEYQAEVEANKKQQEAEQQLAKQNMEDLQKSVKELKEVIPGMNITDAVKDKLYKQMTVPVERDAEGNGVSAIHKKMMENPKEFEIKLNYLFYITDGLSNFDKISKVAKSKAIEDLEKNLKSSSQRVGAGSQSTTDSLQDTGNSFSNLGQIM